MYSLLKAFTKGKGCRRIRPCNQYLLLADFQATVGLRSWEFGPWALWMQVCIVFADNFKQPTIDKELSITPPTDGWNRHSCLTLEPNTLNPTENTFDLRRTADRPWQHDIFRFQWRTAGNVKDLRSLILLAEHTPASTIRLKPRASQSWALDTVQSILGRETQPFNDAVCDADNEESLLFAEDVWFLLETGAITCKQTHLQKHLSRQCDVLNHYLARLHLLSHQDYFFATCMWKSSYSTSIMFFWSGSHATLSQAFQP